MATLFILPVEGVLSERAAAALQELENNASIVRVQLTRIRPGFPVPSSLVDWMEKVNNLKGKMAQAANSGLHQVALSEEESRLVRSAVALKRRLVAEEVNATQRLVRDERVALDLQQQVKPFDQLLAGPLRSVSPLQRPQIGDFVTATGRASLGDASPLGEPALDPKHGILLSASLLANDVPAYREECEQRNKPLAIAFADLDDFKNVNLVMGQVPVDYQLLPGVLNTVENSAYGHGRAYRFGGDEFVLLLPNAESTIATSIVLRLKAAVEALRFEAPVTSVRLSAGIWITRPESHMSAAELVDQAERAKQRAKDLGRSRIVVRTETASGFDETVVE